LAYALSCACAYGVGDDGCLGGRGGSAADSPYLNWVLNGFFLDFVVLFFGFFLYLYEGTVKQKLK
jgi:hypothetical protein